MLVVDDLLAHIHGRPVQVQRTFNRLHGAVHAGAITARRGEQELLDRICHPLIVGAAPAPSRRSRDGAWARGRYPWPMAQRHLDRLTAVDASFLHQEGATRTCTSAGSPLLEGPPPEMEEFLEQIRRRLHLVPRYRHKLAHTALDSGRPVWVDDPSFNLEFHVRHTALPAPGSWEQLRNLTARIFSQALDRSKPLWEMWLIEGLRDGRSRLISKTHHSLIDGIAGVDLATVLFDVSPEPAPLRHSGRAVETQSRTGHDRAR